MHYIATLIWTAKLTLPREVAAPLYIGLPKPTCPLRRSRLFVSIILINSWNNQNINSYNNKINTHWSSNTQGRWAHANAAEISDSSGGVLMARDDVTSKRQGATQDPFSAVCSQNEIKVPKTSGPPSQSKESNILDTAILTLRYGSRSNVSKF